MNETHILELRQFTDPYCTWCWGSEPILRKIEAVYGEQIHITFTMGGLVADMATFCDVSNGICGPQWYSQVADHWVEASLRHGMPVDERIFYDLKDAHFSTYPASISFKAAQFQDEELAKRFLRRMREGAAAERRAIDRPDVQLELAAEVGLDVKRLLADLESGKAKAAFEEDLDECRKRRARGFPTFLVRNPRSNEEITLHGYRQYSQFVNTFHRLADHIVPGDLPVATPETIATFIARYQKVATQEISEIFSINEVEMDGLLTSAMAGGEIHKIKAGNGHFYTTGKI